MLWALAGNKNRQKMDHKQIEKALKAPLLIGAEYDEKGGAAFLYFRDARGFKHRVAVYGVGKSNYGVEDFFYCADNIPKMSAKEYNLLPEKDENYVR
jgi:hypothetical protein